MASDLVPANPAFRERIIANAGQPGFTRLLGTRVVELEPGHATLELDHRDDLRQHHGYFHGGVVGTLGDNACGFAAGTLVAADTYPVTAEYKINLVRPARVTPSSGGAGWCATASR